MAMLNEYTVLLLYPDYVADNYGQETYQAHVMALNEKDAVSKAQVECVQALEGDAEPGSSGIDSLDDLFVLALYEGHLADIKGRAGL